MLVRDPLRRPGQRRAVRRPGERALLDGAAVARRPRRRRPVRRRGRAGGPAPALCPLLAEGAPRPGSCQRGRAVPSPVQPGVRGGGRLHRRPWRPCARGRGRGPGRRLVLARRPGQPGVRQDGQEPEELGQPGRDLRRLRRRHPAGLRAGHRAARPGAALGHQGHRRVVPPAAAGLAHRRRRAHRRPPRGGGAGTRGDAPPAAPDRSRRSGPASRRCGSTPPSPGSPSCATTSP